MTSKYIVCVILFVNMNFRSHNASSIMQKGFEMGELEDKYGHYTIKGCVEKESKSKEDGKDELAYV